MATFIGLVVLSQVGCCFRLACKKSETIKGMVGHVLGGVVEVTCDICIVAMLFKYAVS